MDKLQHNTPWYKQPLVWMLIVIPLSAVFGGISMIYLAVKTNDGLVKDDYYKYGKQINLVLERDLEAKRIGLTGQFDYAPETGAVLVKLATTKSQLPASIMLELQHATRAGHDQNLELVLTPGNDYHGLIKGLIPGRWHIQLTTPRWRLTGELMHPGQTTIKFTAN